ncbi:MAG: hypothetical protein JXJ04_08830 [Spirochaetales bacterium]|nr:hypothetical protein [Spirochaetales bacterium]
MIYNLIIKFGIKKLIIIITFITVFISGSVTFLTVYLVTGEISIVGLLLSTVVPGILAPIQIYYYFQNIVKQKESEIDLQNTHQALEIEYKKVSEHREKLKHLNASMEELVRERTIKLENTLKEKETLLSEIHHRVKNNLQIVISLIRLRKHGLRDENDKQIFTDIENKIMAMALVHEQLYHENLFSKINLKIYMNDLIHNVLMSFSIVPSHINFIQDIDPISLELIFSIPLCIIITEIITNSLKYAFPPGYNGSISLTIKERTDSIIVFIRDDGIGWKRINKSSLGIKIIHTLVQQLDGTIEMSGEGGVAYTITFPREK